MRTVFVTGLLIAAAQTFGRQYHIYILNMCSASETVATPLAEPLLPLATPLAAPLPLR